MNDRFKFRAWNKLSNEMKDVISLNINYEFPDCSNVILETNTFDNIKTHNNPITCANGLNNDDTPMLFDNEKLAVSYLMLNHCDDEFIEECSFEEFNGDKDEIYIKSEII